MRSLSKRVALVGVLALLSTMLAAPLAHAASTTYEIQEGQQYVVGSHCDPQTFQGCTLADEMKFFPHTLTVHKGDVIHITSDGFHTATFLPANTNASEWIDANASNPTQPFSTIVADPDEGTTPTQLDFNTAVVLPSQFTCGTPDQGPCGYDGSAPLNSGLPLGEGESLDFAVTVNANPGDFFYVICLLHHHMRMKVNVVPGGQAASSQSEITARRTPRSPTTWTTRKLSTIGFLLGKRPTRSEVTRCGTSSMDSIPTISRSTRSSQASSLSTRVTRCGGTSVN
ncbi:MAG: hypothetical protein ABR579_04375 [Actinomycetota bacterium]